MKTIRELLEIGINRFEIKYEWDNPLLDMQLLLAKAINKDRLFVMINGNKTVSENEENKYLSLLEKRVNRTPMAYLLNEKEFMGMDFFVKEGVLIPRPDSEALVELILENTSRKSKYNILELGVGSGALIISILKNLDKCIGVGADKYDIPLEVSLENAIKHKINDRVRFIKSDMFKNINGKFDIVLSNPPYIPFKEEEKLQKDLIYEPKEALFAEDKGLYFYKHILEEVNPYLNQDGVIGFELGYNQFVEIEKYIEKTQYEIFKIKKDIQGYIRAILIRRKK
jgi:release factor glutamine methyltransferase